MLYESKNLIWRKIKDRKGHIIQTIAHYLRGGQEAGGTDEKIQFSETQETEKLTQYISLNDLWLNSVDGNYFAEGAEQKVFLHYSGKTVIKLNDAIFYSCWLDYFHSLLLHNHFFSETRYDLLGFWKVDNRLFAVVEQLFVKMTEPTDLDVVKAHLISNGFENTRRNDYMNKSRGIILEDLHDENIIVNNGHLFFVDTVFYVEDKFWLNQDIIIK